MSDSNVVDTALLIQIKEVLSTFPEYWDDKVLLRTKVMEDIRSYKETVIEALLNNKLIKDTYSIVLDAGIIFKVEEFISMLRYKKYWGNSYTKYSNEIGLTSEGKYLNYNTDVVLDFPHKDSILEGGMTKEEDDKKEIYYHNVLAKEEIDTLLSPKVLSNVKRYGLHEEDETYISDTDNLILKGNNLLALHSLKDRYSEKIKLVYIDPPYYFLNKKSDDTFDYNSNFKLSTWLTFMKNRLEIAKEILSNDGSIWISIDEDGQAYLKVLCDEIFGSENFVNNIIWEKRYSPTNDSKWMSDSHDFVLVYAKNKEIWRPNLLPRTDKQNKYYKYDDKDGKGPWRSDNVLVKSFSKSGVFAITNPNTGINHYPPKGSCYRFNKETSKKYLAENRFYFGKDGKGAPQLKRYLAEVKQGVTPMTIWFRNEVTDNQEAKKEVRALNSDNVFSTPKPESLIQRIIHLGSNEGDLVLDFFMGSATTQAVAHKMNRQYIGIEQMDYINTISVPRLKKVIEGEQGGISKNVKWKGGRSFVYAELHSLNDQYIQQIKVSKNKASLDQVLIKIKESAYLNFKVDLELLTSKHDGYQELTLEEMKGILIQVLDMNQLYLNYSEIEDTQHDISDAVKAFNHSFYRKDDKSNPS